MLNTILDFYDRADKKTKRIIFAHALFFLDENGTKEVWKFAERITKQKDEKWDTQKIKA